MITQREVKALHDLQVKADTVQLIAMFKEIGSELENRLGANITAEAMR